MEEKLKQVCEIFRIRERFVDYETIQVGLVNRTYKVNCHREDGTIKSFLVQNVNTYAFRNPVGLMNNIDLVTEHIRAKYPEKKCLHFHHTAERKTYYTDGDNFWRLMNYIPSVTYNTMPDLKTLRNAGAAFGEFQSALSDFDSALLVETIPNFHNTRSRYRNLKQAIAQDAVRRVKTARPEIEYLLSVEDVACTLTDLATQGQLPIRVTHNDTKTNNVLFDPQTRQALAVIDLDT